jgi:hypothetical protein
MLCMRRVRRYLTAFLIAAVIVAETRPARAHTIPADITIHMFVRPVGARLQVLVRVPLVTLANDRVPTHGPGYLDFAGAEEVLRQAVASNAALIAFFEDDTPLSPPRIAAIRVSLPSDQSFASFDGALAHVTGPPLPATTNLIWNQGFYDALLDYEIASDRSDFSVRLGTDVLAGRALVVLRFLLPDGAVRAFELDHDAGVVRLDPRWHQAALTFVRGGFLHILSGLDHLLFLACLVIPIRSVRALIPVVTAFTVAHSITLIASAYDIAPAALWFPAAIETLIALSIVYMAIENIVAATLRRRWIIAFAFGLIHGFGFSFALRQTLQLAGDHLLTSLLSFNIGVELGQIAVLAVLVPAIALMFRYTATERIGTIALSLLLAHTGWHWTLERMEPLRRAQFEWPSLLEMLRGTRWVVAALMAATLLWLAYEVRQRRAAASVRGLPLRRD